MNQNLIIIIPTNGRQNYLNRVAWYYSSFGCMVYICDAYKTSIQINQYDNVKYQWNPNLGFFEEMLDVINHTSADYYLLAPDDDFVKYESLMACYDKMVNDKGIAMSTGKQAFFSETFDGTFKHFSAHNRISDSDGKVKVINTKEAKVFWENYQNIHWSLFSRQCIIDALSKLDNAHFHYACFAEFIMGVESLRHGGIFFHDDYFNYREDSSRPHWGTLAPSICWKNILMSSDLRSDIKKLHSLYGSETFFVYKCLYEYLGNPIVHIGKKIFYKLRRNKPMQREISDSLMSTKIADAFRKM